MNYEFHVGDYVAYSTNDRTHTGYVKKYTHPAFSNEYCFIFQWDDGMQLGWSGRIEELPYNIVRIGAYDFTKKEKTKIEPISDCDKDIFSNAIKSNSQIVRRISDNIFDKINELVDAVNKLMDKEGEE